MSDNNLRSVEELSRLKLVELRAPVNSLVDLNINFAGAFSSLKVLDVSYNTLGPKSFVELGTLPRLTQLDISVNNVGDLPPFGDLRSKGVFPCLQVLVAEQCNFGSLDLGALSLLPRLRDLKVSGNPIMEVPPQCARGFLVLEVLDLSYCDIRNLESVAHAKDLPKLRKIVMHGNDLVPLQRLSKHPLSKKIELEEEPKRGLGGKAQGRGVAGKPTISQMYNIDLKKADLDVPASRMQAFTSLSEEQIDEAFERLQDPMSIFASEDYETVDQGQGEENKEEEEEEDASTTFLTSLGMLQEGGKQEEEEVSEGEEEEVDPSSKLARAFGLDPSKIFSADHLGLDATAAINALKFALNHPLVDYNATGKIEHHMKLTESASRRKLETRSYSPLVAQKYKPSKRKEAIQDMLERMKEKLASAKEKLAAVPAS